MNADTTAVGCKNNKFNNAGTAMNADTTAVGQWIILPTAIYKLGRMQIRQVTF
jgi:hypothetical protein